MRTGVVVPHYGQAAYLARCLASLLTQSRAAEAIVVVDSSPEHTAGIQEAFAGRVTWITSPPRGVAAARNVGLAALDTELVSFLDADNEADRDMLARQVAAFEADPTLVLVHGALRPIDQHGRPYGDVPVYASEEVLRVAQLGWLIERNRVATDTVCARRDRIAALGGFCEDDGVREDYDLWLRLTADGPIRYLPHVLAHYRRHQTNLSNDQTYLLAWEGGALRRQPWEASVEALRRWQTDPADHALACAELRLRRDERDEAVALLRTHWEESRDSRAAFHLAHLAVDAGALAEAAGWLSELQAAGGVDAAAWNNAGVVAARAGQVDLAATLFARARRLVPAYEDARLNAEACAAGTVPAHGWRLTRRRLRPTLLPLNAAA